MSMQFLLVLSITRLVSAPIVVFVAFMQSVCDLQVLLYSIFTLYQAQPLPSGKRAGHKSIYAEMNAFYGPGSLGEALGLFCAVAEDLSKQLLNKAIASHGERRWLDSPSH